MDYDAAYVHDLYVDDDYVGEDELIDYEPRSPLKTDSQSKDSIESELWWSPFINPDEVRNDRKITSGFH